MMDSIIGGALVGAAAAAGERSRAREDEEIN